ncbi:hypothetical protein BGZ97_011177 [Linnemannia gamsii]|uniref:MD-2-related lipid-recognition domain-containing protein n=1 Tax=Linnemannia gamsii TaxID=64522 RepID=A0A9P6R736_9FUNG|nr:hypothetical protein BGZ97_011177 [Linnemannia gamsii]
MTLALLSQAVLGQSQPAPPVFTNCHPGPTQQIGTIFSVNPYPLCTGLNVCMTAQGSLVVPITAGGQLAIRGFYLGRSVYVDNQDLCTVLALSGYPCPVPYTFTSVTMCVRVKSIPLNMALRMQFSAVNGDGGVIFCQTSMLTAKVC